MAKKQSSTGKSNTTGDPSPPARTMSPPTSAPETMPAPATSSTVTQPTSQYTVVARRYRPQQFADLVGQEHVANALQNAITSQRIAHAFLFTGARGTGKTSTARILAKALNCVTGPTATPCDLCESCRAIIDGNDVDVLEIDGASNNKVDEIRDLKSNVAFRPQRGRFKIYIIDEVHMLSVAAFNALLKTLEEPPPHVKFIFATTEVQKIPITILSRCQRFDFAAITPAKVRETLRQIVRREGLSADDDALEMISRRANGSMRDAQTLLDQLLSFSTGGLTAARVHELLGTAAEDRLLALVEAIIQQQPAVALAQIEAAAQTGQQLGEWLDQLLEFFRGLMLVQVGGPPANPAAILGGTAALREAQLAQGPALPIDWILAGLDLLTAAKTKLRTTTQTQIIVEMTVVRLCLLDQFVSLGQLAQQVGRVSLAVSPPADRRPAPPQPRANPATPGSPQTSPQDEPSKKNDRVTVSPAANLDPSETYGDLAPRTWPRVWQKVLEQLGPVRRLQLEPAGLPAILGPNSLAIRIPAVYSSAYEDLNREANLESLRKALRTVTGRDCQIVLERLAANPGPGSGPGPGVGSTESPNEPTAARRELMKWPLFARAADVLGASLMRCDEGFNPQDRPLEERTTPWTDTAAPQGEEASPAATDPGWADTNRDDDD